MTANADLSVVRDGAVLRLRIERPQKHNALSRQVLAELKACLQQHAGDRSLACAVITGAGSRYFAAGGDLRDLAAVRSEADTRGMAQEARAALDAVRAFPVPVVAALNGDAIGGGAELAVACDFRVMSGSASVGFVHGRLKITSAWGGGPDLVTLVGPARALYMTTTCTLVSAQTALAWGLADAVAGDAALEDTVQGFIEPMLRQSPFALRACKAQARAFRCGLPWGERVAMEEANFVATWTHPDHWAAVDNLLRPGGAAST